MTLNKILAYCALLTIVAGCSRRPDTKSASKNLRTNITLPKGHELVETHSVDFNYDTVKDQILFVKSVLGPKACAFTHVYFVNGRTQQVDTFSNTILGYQKRHLVYEPSETSWDFKSLIQSPTAVHIQQSPTSSLLFLVSDTADGEVSYFTTFRFSTLGPQLIFSKPFHFKQYRLDPAFPNQVFLVGSSCREKLVPGTSQVYTYAPLQAFRVTQQASLDLYITDKYNRQLLGYYHNAYCTDDVYVVKVKGITPYIIDAATMRKLYMGGK